jgi:UrcA family protein
LENDMTKLNSLIFTALIGILSQASPAAEPTVPSLAIEPQQLLVRFADLDLTRPDGAKSLFQRIKHAAETVCSPRDRSTLASHQLYKACVADAISTAVTQVDRPRLNAYYQSKVQGRHVMSPQSGRPAERRRPDSFQ